MFVKHTRSKSRRSRFRNNNNKMSFAWKQHHIALARKTSNSTKSSSSKSVLTQFFQEPQLGQTWYSPQGPIPVFQADQKNGTVYEAGLGSDALLDCQVTALERDLVSWFRKKGALDLTLLTVGFRPYSAENRFILDFQSPHNYRLRIQNVQWRDEGIYQCQIATDPPQVSWAKLVLVRPIVHLLDGESQPVRDLHYDAGSTIELVCRVKRPPLHFVSIVWDVEYSNFGEERNATNELNKDVIRGGIKIDTGRNDSSGYLISKLSLAKATDSDAGNYSCRLSIMPKDESRQHGLSDTVAVHILHAENTEAIQSAGSKAVSVPTICK